MKKIYVFTLLVLFILNVNAQSSSWQWAKKAGGSSNDVGYYGNTTDLNGNLYVTGHFISTSINFGGTVLTNAGNWDSFIVKYNALGIVQWAKRIGGTNADWIYDITTDRSGNVFITGSFISPTLTIGSTTLTNAGGGGKDFFIAKYDSTGNPIWAKRAGGISDDVGYGISTDTTGNIFVTGTYINPITFGGFTLTNAGLNDFFAVKYDALGNVIWAKGVGGSGGDTGVKIVNDTIGNKYAIGYFDSPSLTFGSTTLINAGVYNMFIVKYDALGNVVWAKGSSGGIAQSIYYDKNDNLYLTGYFNGSISFGSIYLVNTGGAGQDMFVVKYDTSGNVIWAISAADCEGQNITTDKIGNVYVSGDFLGATITFGTTTLSQAGLGDLFVVKYDSLGNVIWAKSAGGTSTDTGLGISTDSNFNVYVSGWFNSPTITFGSTTLSNSGSQDFFVAKLCQITIPTITPSGSTTFCQGDSVTLSSSIENTYLWSTGATTQNITITTSGNYSVTVTNVNGCSSISAVESVIVNPSTPIITQSGTNLSSSAATSYQWYLNGIIITGANSQNYTVIQNGNYTVIVTDSTGCSATSAPFVFNNIGINESIINSICTINPNPFNYQTTVTFNKEVKNITLKIFDMLGKEVRSVDFSGTQLLINKGELKEGIYFIQIVTENKTILNKKIIIE